MESNIYNRRSNGNKVIVLNQIASECLDIENSA